MKRMEIFKRNRTKRNQLIKKHCTPCGDKDDCIARTNLGRLTCIATHLDEFFSEALTMEEQLQLEE